MSTKDFIEKDYYKVLGVPKDATDAEIKKAYRKLAREFHPDANKGDAKAEERFKEISEANDVLGDPKKRKEYDEARALFGNGGFRAGSRRGRRQLQLRPGRPLRRRRPGRRQGGPAASAAASATSSAACSTAAARAPDAYPAPARPGHRDRGDAQLHRGGGRRDGPAADDQPGALQGLFGHRRQERHTPRAARPASAPARSRAAPAAASRSPTRAADCKGRGLIAEDPCDDLPRQRPGQVLAHHAGAHPGGRQRRPADPAARQGRARASAAARPATCTSRSTSDAHPVFGRKGDNLTVTVPVTFTEAALGGEMRVPTLGGPAGHAEAAAGHAQRPHHAGPRQGRGPQGRHPGRPAGHRRGGGPHRTCRARLVTRWRRIARRPRARTRGRSCSRPRREREGRWTAVDATRTN